MDKTINDYDNDGERLKQTPSASAYGVPSLQLNDSQIIIENGCVLHPDQCALIRKMSILSLLSAIYAIYNSHYDLALVPGGIFLTTLIYWKNPRYDSWQRIVDITYVSLGLLYQLIRAYNSEYYKLYYIVIFVSLLFYPISFYYYNKKLYWYSTYAHIMLHIGANISNIILYSGTIDPLFFFTLFNKQEIITIETCVANVI